MSPQKIVVLHGNNNVGKSTLCELLNSRYGGNEFIFFQKSSYRDDETINCHRTLFNKLDISIFDDSTYTFEHRRRMINRVDGIPVYNIILTATLSTLLKRVSKCENPTKFMCEKSLAYFNNVFEEKALYYGFPMVSTDHDIEQTISYLMTAISNYSFYQMAAFRDINLAVLATNNLFDRLVSSLHEIPFNLIRSIEKKYPEITIFLPFGDQTDGFISYWEDDQMRAKLYAQKIIDDGEYVYIGNSIVFSYGGNMFPIVLDDKPYFIPVLEGESKQLYKIVGKNYENLFANYYVIALKPTIYSHSSHSSNEIVGLSEIKALTNKLLLEELWRNNITHAYKCITDDALILSERVKPSRIESTFKAYCTNADKHSFFDLTDNADIVYPDGQYKSGPYPSFIMKNPKHVTVEGKINVSRSSYYYHLERHYGKQKFTCKFLKNEKFVTHMSDRVISPYILNSQLDTYKTQTIILKTYATLENFFGKLGVLVQDGCLMISDGKIYSELNPECINFKDIDHTNPTESWSNLNKMMVEHFTANRFMTEICNKYGYQDEVKWILDCDFDIHPDINIIWKKLRDSYKVIGTHSRKQIIVEMDIYDGKHVLVKEGKVINVIGDPVESIKKISMFPNIFLVDLSKDRHSNKEIIMKLCDNRYHSGGIRNIFDAQEILSNNATGIGIDSKLCGEFLPFISKECLIIEFHINEFNRVMAHDRSSQNDDIIDRINSLNIEAISITFNNTEGILKYLPREQIAALIPRINKKIKKIIITDINLIEDINFLWLFDSDRVIPRIGYAFWSEKINKGDIYRLMANYHQGLIHATIQSENGIVKGSAYLCQEALYLTSETGFLHRFSRGHNKIIARGEISGETQQILKMCFNCHNDHLLITVTDNHKFCHRGCYSCFPIYSHVKIN